MAARPRVAAVGHVEWIDFARVDHVPVAGEIEHGTEHWQEPGGGGAVAAVQLARLAGGADFYTALGDDELGHRSVQRLTELGVTVHVAWRQEPTRRGVTLVDKDSERTIITLGPRLEPRGGDDLPWPALAEADGVYFTAGDEAALRAARQARVLTASPRGREALLAGIPLDALILSGEDAGERRAAERLSTTNTENAPELVVLTDGARGGTYQGREGTEGRWAAAPLPGPPSDSYGAGDSFAAGLTFGLARGDEPDAALHIAALCGAYCLSGKGPYGRQLTAADLESG